MKTVCPQCHTDGHHKMSCTDESNPARKDRVTVPTSLKEPIVDGAYYVDRDGVVLRFGKVLHDEHAKNAGFTRVYIVPTDPAEVVVELRELQKTAKHMSKTLFENLVAQREHTGAAIAFENAADLVAEKLGVAS